MVKAKKVLSKEEETDAEAKEDVENKCNKSEDSEDKPDDVEPEMEKSDDEEDESDLTPEEKAAYSKIKLKLKKRKMKKSEGSAVSPEESAEDSTNPEHTISAGPKAEVPSAPQDVFVPQSQVDGQRTQDTPMATVSVSKSVNPDLVKSPLFVSLSGQIEEMRKALDAKFDSIAKSYNDRLDNMKKSFEETEANLKKFYSGSFHKAISENISLDLQPIAKQLESGNVRFSK